MSGQTTQQHCLDMAAEADRLADLVSYGRDKTRLREQAQAWRDKATAVGSVDPQPEAPVSSTGPLARLFTRRRS